MQQSRTKCRPIISSLAFNNTDAYLPFNYDFTIQQMVEIKKYLPKNIFKLIGVDIEAQQLKKEEEELLAKSKLKVRARNARSIENSTPLNYIPKKQVKIIQWYNKSINLKIPFSSKSTPSQIQENIQSYVGYYLDNFMLFKNTLSNQLYMGKQELQNRMLTVEQLSTEVDILFLEWNIDKDPAEDQEQIIRVNVPVILCLNVNQTYSLQKLREILINDIQSSLSIQLKHQFNTRVLIQGCNQKQLICLNSYCNQENALNEEEKLRTIIGQQKIATIQTEETQVNAKKDHKFLILILGFLVLIYFYLKIFPIHGRNENQYLKPTTQQPNQQANIDFNQNNDQQLF